MKSDNENLSRILNDLEDDVIAYTSSLKYTKKRIDEIKLQITCDHPDDKVYVRHGIHSYEKCTLCGYEIMD